MQEYRNPTKWSGLMIFAAVLLMIVGGFNMVYGFVALLEDDQLIVGPEGLLVFNTTTWGVILLVLGLIQVATGIAIVGGQTWARIVGVVFAAVNALSQMAVASAHPVWSSMIIIFDVLVIYALTVHGREMEY